MGRLPWTSRLSGGGGFAIGTDRVSTAATGICPAPLVSWSCPLALPRPVWTFLMWPTVKCRFFELTISYSRHTRQVPIRHDESPPFGYAALPANVQPRLPQFFKARQGKVYMAVFQCLIATVLQRASVQALQWPFAAIHIER